MANYTCDDFIQPYLKINNAAIRLVFQYWVTYDELTINERQKGDQEFFAMLECIRRGFTTEETLATLRKRLIDVSVEEKFWELSKQGKSPVCLFAKRKNCEEVNKKMKEVALLHLIKMLPKNWKN